MSKRKTYDESIESIANEVYHLVVNNKRPIPLVIDDIKASTTKKINAITTGA